MRSILFLSVCLVFAPSVLAAEPYVPEELESWVEWVLDAHPDHNCPRNYYDGAIRDCIWTRALTVEVVADRLTFTLATTLHAEANVPLPGNDRYWPQAVRANDREVVVTRAGQRPVVRLAAGVYDITGSVAWQQRPDGVSIPRQFGLLSLVVDGQDVARPTVNNQYLWFGERQSDAVRESDSIEIDVYRLLIDENPMVMRTYLRLTVGGRSRVETLGRLLLPNFVITRLESELPARLGEDGNLKVQVEAGEFVVEVYARATSQPTELTMSATTDNWPAQEIWAFDPRRNLRLVNLSGASGVDLNQLEAPFKGNLRGFLMDSDSKFLIQTEQRGDPTPVPNDFSLRRDLWLNFDGSGLIVRDQVDAAITHATRLSAGYSLGRIAVNGDNQLVTSIASGEPGIELQNGRYRIESVSALPSRQGLNAVGWNVDATSLQATLHLPPGWRLMWTSGVDSAPGAWLARWTLWDVFLITLTLVLIWQFFNHGFAALVGITLLIAYQEAPAIGVAWLAVVGLIATQRAVSHDRVRRLLRGTMVIALVSTALLSVDFAIDHARQSLHPQLEQVAYRVTPYAAPNLRVESTVVADKLGDLLKKVPSAEARLEEIVVTSSILRRTQYPKGIQVQTGPGLPAWQWKAEELRWFGPVSESQEMSLILLPPVIVRVLNALMAALVLIVTVALGYMQYSSAITWRPPRWLASVLPVPLVTIVLIAVLLPFEPAHAQLVDSEILKDLERRLLEPPRCLPTCASIERVTLNVDADELEVTLRIHTGAFLAVPLPGTLDGWMPTSVNRNGASVPITRDGEGRLQVALESGVHDIIMRGLVNHLNRVELTFPLRPGRVEVTEQSNWELKGLIDGRLPSGSLTLERIVRASEADTQTLQQEPAPPYVRLYRSVHFGLEWRVQSRVERVAPVSSAMTVRIPTLAGESILDRELRVEDGTVLVVFDASDDAVSWTSTIPQTETIQLVAGDLAERTEIWELLPSNLWHISHAGIVPSKAPDSSGPVFHPYSGEVLTVTTERTQPIAGPTATIESVHLNLVPGSRVRTANLELTLRASEGGNYPVHLPDGAVVSAVSVNGEVQPIPLNDGVVALPVTPGETSYEVNWRNEVAGGLIFTTPRVDLASPANNITLTTQFPRDRWVLLLGGPDLGPAMLFWGVLIVVTLLGLALSQVPGLPLTAVDAVLLATGLTLCNLPTTLLVAAWFIVMLVRERWVDATERRALKNSIQVLTAAVSVVAVLALVLSVPFALLGSPEMQITGYGSTGYNYRWFSDHSGEGLPTAWVFSLPLWIYRGAMLAWSLWLAFALLRWMKWAWQRWVTPVGWFAK
ncbi:MAG: hypothetical protein E2O61_11825 [Gammaproteobacteria bacterium]|nr:MAG: hypothetical protein E2O61_11825 [Gammaproteobacteria bacterium]